LSGGCFRALYLTAHKAEPAYNQKGPKKWGDKEKNSGFTEKQKFAIRCCAAITSVQNFPAEDVMVYCLVK